jgi:beta-lactamase regulating signal transducer with metallopeptidase domain
VSAELLLIDITIVFVVAMCGVHLARRAPAAVRHLILTSAFGAVAVLPVAMLVSPSMTVEIRALPPRAAEPISAVPPDAGPSSAEAVLPAPAAVASVTPGSSMTSAAWVRLVWAAVGLLAFAPVGVSVWRFRTIRRGGRAWAEGSARLNALVREAGMRRPVALRLHDEIVAPIAGGLLRPVIVLPADAVTWSETQVGNALVHELEHVRRRDWLVHLGARSICALYWFHPLAWMALRRLRLEAEHVCDDAVLARGDGTVYAEQLLMLARRLLHTPVRSLLSMGSGSNLSSRITAVLDDTRPRGRAGRKVTTCILAAASLTVAALAPLRAAGPLPEPAAIFQAKPASGPSAADGRSAGQGFPRRFASHSEAVEAGCRFAAVKGPATDTCVLTGFRDRHLDIVVYERVSGGAYAASDEMAISSWFEGATLSLVDLLGNQTDWLVIDTEGMRGPGMFQRVLLVIGWDGSRFRTAAAESLHYRCSRPTSPEDYRLEVRHAFAPLRGAPGLHFEYQLMRADQRIGVWSDRLRWSAAQFAFTPFESSADVTEPITDRIREQIGRVRVYSAVRPLDPARDSSPWMGNSELLNVLSPACAPSLRYVTRPFAGKWMLDAERTAAANPGGASLDVALVVSWDRRALTVSPTNGGRNVYRLDGAETTVPVGEATGRATAAMDGDRMVVTITIEGRSRPLRRIYYLDGRSLVIEEYSGAEETGTRAYYDKS